MYYELQGLQIDEDPKAVIFELMRFEVMLKDLQCLFHCHGLQAFWVDEDPKVMASMWMKLQDDSSPSSFAWMTSCHKLRDF